MQISCDINFIKTGVEMIIKRNSLDWDEEKNIVTVEEESDVLDICKTLENYLIEVEKFDNISYAKASLDYVLNEMTVAIADDLIEHTMTVEFATI